MRSHCVVSPEQLLIPFTQELKPKSSGSRPRKSMYCCRTKKLVPSIGFGPSTVSLSMMVTVAVDGVPKLAPVGLLRLTRKVSLPSAYESSTMATEKLFDVASPAAHVNVPIVLMKSQRGEAVPLIVLHSCKPASSMVAMATEAAALVSPERVTVMFTRKSPSPTE